MNDNIHKTHFQVPELPWKDKESENMDKSKIVIKKGTKSTFGGCIQSIDHDGEMYEIRLEKGTHANVYTLCWLCLNDLYNEIERVLETND